MFFSYIQINDWFLNSSRGNCSPTKDTSKYIFEALTSANFAAEQSKRNATTASACPGIAAIIAASQIHPSSNAVAAADTASTAAAYANIAMIQAMSVIYTAKITHHETSIAITAAHASTHQGIT